MVSDHSEILKDRENCGSEWSIVEIQGNLWKVGEHDENVKVENVKNEILFDYLLS